MTDDLKQKKLDEWALKKSTQPLPMPEGGTRLFTMTNWHWWVLEEAEKVLYFTPRTTVETVIEWDWDTDLDTKMMASLEDVYNRYLLPRFKEKERTGDD